MPPLDDFSRRVAIACLLVALVTASRRAAADTSPRDGWSHAGAIAVRLNPQGLFADVKVRRRWSLYDSPSPTLAQNFFGVAPSVLVSPALIRPGFGLEFGPLSVLHLYLGYEPLFYLGTFSSLHSYRSARADYPSGVLGAPSHEHGDVYPALVHKLTLNGTLQARRGPFVARSSFRLHYLAANTRRGEPVYYDPTYDVLVPRRGFVLEDDTDVGYATDSGLTVGARFSLLQTWYPANAYLPGEGRDNLNTPILRLGPVLSYTFFEHRTGAFDTSTVTLAPSWYIRHRYRAGESTSRAVPYITLTFSFSGRL